MANTNGTTKNAVSEAISTPSTKTPSTVAAVSLPVPPVAIVPVEAPAARYISKRQAATAAAFCRWQASQAAAEGKKTDAAGWRFAASVASNSGDRYSNPETELEEAKDFGKRFQA